MKPTVRLLRKIMPVIAIICSLVFIPWALVWAWLVPLLDSVQEQVDGAINHRMDGVEYHL